MQMSKRGGLGDSVATLWRAQIAVTGTRRGLPPGERMGSRPGMDTRAPPVVGGARIRDGQRQDVDVLGDPTSDPTTLDTDGVQGTLSRGRARHVRDTGYPRDTDAESNRLRD